jgi:hypothetical protein
MSTPPPLFLGGLLWLWMILGRLLPALTGSRRASPAGSGAQAPSSALVVEIERKKIA